MHREHHAECTPADAEDGTLPAGATELSQDRVLLKEHVTIQIDQATSQITVHLKTSRASRSAN